MFYNIAKGAYNLGIHAQFTIVGRFKEPEFVFVVGYVTVPNYVYSIN